MVLADLSEFLQSALEGRLYIAVGAVVCLVLFQWILHRDQCAQLPIVGIPSYKLFPMLRARFQYVKNGEAMILDGFRKNAHKIFRIPTINQILILLPPEFIEEIKSQPESTMSSSHAVSDYFMGEWTTLHIDMFGETLWSTLRAQFTSHIGDQVEPLDDECHFSFAEEFSSCKEWTPIVVLPKILNLVSQTTARLTVGLPICRNKLWLETTADYAICVFRSAAVFKMLPIVLRPFASIFLPFMHRIRRHHRNARKIILPEILSRRERYGDVVEDKHSGVMPDGRLKDSLDWLAENSEGEHLRPERMVLRMLGISFAATHTTTNHITNTIFDLATRWDEYAAELRQEIEEVTGGRDVMLTDKVTLARLSKLDSFMKESQRLNPASSFSINRKLMKEHTLSDGTVLPRSSYISIPSGPMSISDGYHADPEVFDGFRYHRMRQAVDGNPHGGQFSTTSHGNLQFGHGRFACPGRFFASMQSKLILIRVIMAYDLKLADGDEGRRPQNVKFADVNVPSPEQVVMFRNRAD